MNDQPHTKPTTSEITIPVVEEHLEVGTRQVDTGHAVRVRKHVDEVPADLDTPIVHHTVDIERVPVGRVMEAPPAVRREGDVLVIPVIEERVLTRTELVLVEEIRITHKRQTQAGRTQLTVRRERVVVERFDPATERWVTEDPDSREP